MTFLFFQNHEQPVCYTIFRPKSYPALPDRRRFHPDQIGGHAPLRASRYSPITRLERGVVSLLIAAAGMSVADRGAIRLWTDRGRVFILPAIVTVYSDPSTVIPSKAGKQ